MSRFFLNVFGKVGSAVFFPQINLTLQFNLPLGLSVYYAEAYAILKALHYSKENNLTNFCIVSDSSSVLRDIKFAEYDVSPHPYLLHQILEIITTYSYSKVQIKWMPGHSNQPSFRLIDSLAKTSSSLSYLQPIQYTSHEASLITDRWSWDRWKDDWGKNQTTKYQNIFSLQSYGWVNNTTRKRDTIINRLRLLQTYLNGDQHKIGLHKDGLCLTCGVTQDPVHFIMDCPDTTNLRTSIRKSFGKSAGEWSYKNIISDPLSTDIVINYVLKHNISI